MKKYLMLLLALVIVPAMVSGQEKSSESKKPKTDQTKLYNEFYFSYGGGSFYYSVNQDRETTYSSSGTFMIGYHRVVNKTIAIGFQGAFLKVNREEPYHYDPYYSYGGYKYEDNMWQALANIRFTYIYKPMLSVYSSFGLGVTTDYYSETNINYPSDNFKGRQLMTAIQATLLGFRVGRSFAAFGEFGIGTLQIINLGVSYKFGQ